MIEWRRRLLSVFLLTVGLMACSRKRDSGGNLQQPADFYAANAAFDAGQYSQALRLYQKVAQAQPQSAEVWYNLGNAEYRSRHLAAAILAYRKALLRNPQLKGAKENLTLAQNRLPGQLSAGEAGWKSAVSSPGSSNTWAIMAIVFFVALTAVVAFRRREAAFARMGLVLPLALFWLVSLGLSWYSLKSEKELRAVVMRPVSLENGAGKSVADLPEGLVLRLPEGAASGRTAVQLPDGRRGFLSGSALGLIN